MTPSDPESPPDNPFDLGLPMLRVPEPSRRGRRARRREPVAPPPALPAAGDWAEWLDPRPTGPPEPPRPSNSHRIDPSDDVPVRVPPLIDRSGGNPGPRVRRTRNRNAPAGSDRILGVLVMFGVAVVVVSVLLTVIHTGRHRTPTMAAPQPAAPESPGVAASSASTSASAPTAIATDDCRSLSTPDVVSGTGPGGTASGPDAILAFERAYYVQRSGFAARAVVADDAQVPPAAQIQRGIDKIPPGTRYCVQITKVPALDGQYEVLLTQELPTAQRSTFTQIITTQSAGGRTLISAIAAG